MAGGSTCSFPERKSERMTVVGLTPTLEKILNLSNPELDGDSKDSLQKLIESVSSTGELDKGMKDEIEQTLVYLEWEGHLSPYPPEEAHSLINDALGILHRA